MSPEIAKDVAILPVNAEHFQVRVWTESDDSIRASVHDALLDSSQKLSIDGKNLFLFTGRGAKSDRALHDSYEEPFNPIFRFANTKDWNSLFKNVRDSVFLRIPGLSSQKTALAGNQEAADFILETHKFIQDSLRYVSLAFGDRAYVPSFPDTVLKNRMGDCKDFSVLMISKLRKAGIEAYPTLVNSRLKHMFFPGPPSFDAVDHMVVFIPKFNWWVDPTAEVNPPDLVPFHLSDAQALVLFPDSIVLKRLPTNDDKAFAGSVEYNCRESGSDLKCIKRITYSRRDSWDIRGYLKRRNPIDINEKKYQQDFFGGLRVTQDSTKYLNIDLEKENLKEEVALIGHGAVVKVAGKSVIRFPETPSSLVFAYATQPGNRKAVTISNPIFRTVYFTLETKKPLVWPNFKNSTNRSYRFEATKISSGKIKIMISIPVAEISTEQRKSLDEVLGNYKDFFSSAIIAG